MKREARAALVPGTFKMVTPEQFDAYVWFEVTNAITPMGSAVPQDVPETYPFGL